MGNYISRMSDSLTSVINYTNTDHNSKKKAKKRKYNESTKCTNVTPDTNNDNNNLTEQDDYSTDDDASSSTSASDLEAENDHEIDDELSQNLSNMSAPSNQHQADLSSSEQQALSYLLTNSTTSATSRPTRSYEDIREPNKPQTSTSKKHRAHARLKRNHKEARIERRLKTPTKKKMKSTSTYIYNTLFLNGENSDITLRALNKDWRLHKVYLCQSAYFASMLASGKWKECTQLGPIDISIPDAKITEHALHVSFGSLYKDDIEIRPLDVVNVLAAASLFSLDGLIAECASIMLENVNVKTVVYYYEAAVTYGIQRVIERCLQWLCMNIMWTNELRLNEMSLALFSKVIQSPELMMIQVETDLYTLCKRWLYYQLSGGWVANSMAASCASVCGSNATLTGRVELKGWQKAANEFFGRFMREKGVEYVLDAEELAVYLPIFKQVRVQYILTDLSSLRLMRNDRIIPAAWIEPFYCANWLNTLYIDQHTESTEFEIDEVDFRRECVRFGRILNEDVLHTWRWVGFHFGIDLLVTYMHRSFTLKRNTMYIYSPYKGLLSNKPTQRIYFVLSAAHLDKFGNVKWFKKTEFTCLDLHRNEEKFVFNFDNTVQFPLIMNLHVACHPTSASASCIMDAPAVASSAASVSAASTATSINAS